MNLSPVLPPVMAAATNLFYSPDDSDTDPVKASVAHLLTKAYSLPCSTAAQAFTHLVQPMVRFQLALDALLPLLDAGAVDTGHASDGQGEQIQLAELPQRILVAYILFSMYAPYPITVNPFKSVLLVTFVRERNGAIRTATQGGLSANEQLVWVLWKILKGDGNDIGPYTPSTLARSPLPAKLRASNLILDDALYNTMFDIDENPYSYFQPHHPRMRSASSDPNHEKQDLRLRTVRTMDEDKHNEKVAHGMKLVLAARDRVLTLTEQRLLIPIIPDIAESQMVASLDLAPLAALNPQITHLLIVSLFNNTTKTADFELLFPYLDTLACLPPTRPSFDLIGRLIQDSSPISLTGYSTVADLIRMEVLGRFVHECIMWLERAELDEREGLVSDDRYSQGVQNLCRFFNSLVKLSIVDPMSDVDSAEMAHFSLRHARTAQLIIQLARDDLYGLDNGVDGGLSDLEFALAEQEREFMQFWMDYGDAQVQRSTAAVPAVGAQAGPGGDNATRQAPAFAPPAAPPSPALHDIAPPDSDTDDSEDDLITFPQDHLPPNIQLQHVIPQIGPGVWLENQVDDIPSPPRSPSPVGSDSDGASLPDVVPFLGPIVIEEVVHNWPAYTLTEPPSPVASVAYTALPTIGVRGIRVFREDESDEEEGGQGGQGYVAPEAPPRIRAMNPFDIVVTNVEPQVECVFCKDHFPASFTLRTPCEQAQHHLCRSCVTRNVELCTRDETAYPPKCCTNKLPLRDMLKLMDDARLRATYEVKTVDTSNSRHFASANPSAGLSLPNKLQPPLSEQPPNVPIGPVLPSGKHRRVSPSLFWTDGGNRAEIDTGVVVLTNGKQKQDGVNLTFNSVFPSPSPLPASPLASVDNTAKPYAHDIPDVADDLDLEYVTRLQIEELQKIRDDPKDEQMAKQPAMGTARCSLRPRPDRTSTIARPISWPLMMPSNTKKKKTAALDLTLERECTGCFDPFEPLTGLHSSCGHHYCQPCVHNMVTASVSDESLFPPKCCNQPLMAAFASKDNKGGDGGFEQIKLLGLVLDDRALKEKMESRWQEWSVKPEERVYCSNASCAVFLGSATGFDAGDESQLGEHDSKESERAPRPDVCRQWGGAVLGHGQIEAVAPVSNVFSGD
ncbi:hypothetical protein APHAL10511_006611 [Amanita phalloides]|nr:hypothetical protein APHAL10511_006611 [Amanita phalloides]